MDQRPRKEIAMSNDPQDNDIPITDEEHDLLIARLGTKPLVFNELNVGAPAPQDRPSVRYLVEQVYRAVDSLEEREIDDIALSLLEALARYEAAAALEIS
jgi:hypothetical protein